MTHCRRITTTLAIALCLPFASANRAAAQRPVGDSRAATTSPPDLLALAKKASSRTDLVPTGLSTITHARAGLIIDFNATLVEVERTPETHFDLILDFDGSTATGLSVVRTEMRSDRVLHRGDSLCLYARAQFESGVAKAPPISPVVASFVRALCVRHVAIPATLATIIGLAAVDSPMTVPIGWSVAATTGGFCYTSPALIRSAAKMAAEAALNFVCPIIRVDPIPTATDTEVFNQSSPVPLPRPRPYVGLVDVEKQFRQYRDRVEALLTRHRTVAETLGGVPESQVRAIQARRRQLRMIDESLFRLRQDDANRRDDWKLLQAKRLREFRGSIDASVTAAKNRMAELHTSNSQKAGVAANAAAIGRQLDAGLNGLRGFGPAGSFSKTRLDTGGDNAGDASESSFFEGDGPPKPTELYCPPDDPDGACFGVRPRKK